MAENPNLQLSVSEFIAVLGQTLEYAYPSVDVEGEVASFKVNQGKYVFFDLKDAHGSISCFMTVWQLRVAVEDGMRVVVTAAPKLTQWGKFSLTVRQIRPSGEGNLKKSFELLRARLDQEGLFAPERKRVLPILPNRVAVISSIHAAGYGDFIKILSDRFGGMHIDVANVQVQGADAPDQIIHALKYFNSREEIAEVIVLIRGGGSADDLRAFNDELLAREIAASRIPTLVGVGHEMDVSLADMVADVRAATPSNAAQVLVPDRNELIRGMHRQLQSLLPRTEQAIERQRQGLRQQLERSFGVVNRQYDDYEERLIGTRRVLNELDPMRVLDRGYALVRGAVAIGKIIEIEKSDILITAEVRHVNKK